MYTYLAFFILLGFYVLPTGAMAQDAEHAHSLPDLLKLEASELAHTYKWTPLHRAAALGTVDLARTIIMCKNDINAKNSDGNTPLHLACTAGHNALVQLLLEAGAYPYPYNKRGKTPLGEALAQYELEHNAHYPNLVTLFKEYNENLNTAPLGSLLKSRTALHRAAKKGNIPLVLGLLEHNYRIDNLNYFNETALYDGIRSGNLALVELLLSAGISADKAPEADISPFCFAIRYYPSVDLVKTLLKYTKPDQQSFLEAIGGGEKVEILTYFLKHVRVARLYITQGLRKALYNNCSPEVVRLLLYNGADAGALDELGLSMWWYAFKDLSDKEAIKLLLRSQATKLLNHKNYESYPLTSALFKGRDIVELLIKQGADVNASSIAGTALHEAVRYDLTEIVQVLLDAGADVNARNVEGDTPLHVVAQTRFGHITEVKKEILKKLLSDPKINTELVNNRGQTPLMLAQEGKDSTVIKLLTPAKACPICYDSGNDFIETSCKHIFHKACLLEWLTKGANKNCPICRGPLDGSKLT